VGILLLIRGCIELDGIVSTEDVLLFRAQYLGLLTMFYSFSDIVAMADRAIEIREPTALYNRANEFTNPGVDESHRLSSANQNSPSSNDNVST